MAQPPSSNPHTIWSFPGAGVFFMIQPLAIILEPFIISRIPKCLGGSRLWLWTFTTLAAIPFCSEYLSEGRMVSGYRPLSQWSLLYALSPIKEWDHTTSSVIHRYSILSSPIPVASAPHNTSSCFFSFSFSSRMIECLFFNQCWYGCWVYWSICKISCNTLSYHDERTCHSKFFKFVPFFLLLPYEGSATWWQPNTSLAFWVRIPSSLLNRFLPTFGIVFALSLKEEIVKPPPGNHVRVY